MRKTLVSLLLLVMVMGTFGCASTGMNQQGRQDQQDQQYNNATKKAAQVGVLTLIGSALYGGHGKDHLGRTVVGTLVGYIWGNEQDKTQAKRYQSQSQNKRYQGHRRYQTDDRNDRRYQTRSSNETYEQQRARYNNNSKYNNERRDHYSNNNNYNDNNNGEPQTKCKMVTVRKFKDGVWTEEKEERCIATKTTDWYE